MKKNLFQNDKNKEPSFEERFHSIPLNPWLAPLTIFQRIVIFTLSFLLVIGVSAIDLITGKQYSIFSFYTIPVSLTFWFSGRFWGIMISLISAGAWIYVDILLNPKKSLSLIPFWNFCSWILFLASIGWILSLLKERLQREVLMSRLDYLTMVYNSRGFYERVEEELSWAIRKEEPVALAYIDLDYFKTLNDTRGHQEGDRALALVGKTLTQNLRSHDIVGRIGGDEFVIFLFGISLEDIKKTMERIQKELLTKMEEKEYPITFSIGVAYYPKPPSHVEEMLYQSDKLMYNIKGTTKNDIMIKSVDLPCQKGEPHGTGQESKKIHT